MEPSGAPEPSAEPLTAPTPARPATSPSPGTAIPTTPARLPEPNGAAPQGEGSLIARTHAPHAQAPARGTATLKPPARGRVQTGAEITARRMPAHPALPQIPGTVGPKPTARQRPATGAFHQAAGQATARLQCAPLVQRTTRGTAIQTQRARAPAETGALIPILRQMAALPLLPMPSQAIVQPASAQLAQRTRHTSAIPRTPASRLAWNGASLAAGQQLAQATAAAAAQSAQAPPRGTAIPKHLARTWGRPTGATATAQRPPAPSAKPANTGTAGTPTHAPTLAANGARTPAEWALPAQATAAAAAQSVQAPHHGIAGRRRTVPEPGTTGAPQ